MEMLKRFAKRFHKKTAEVIKVTIYVEVISFLLTTFVAEV